MQLIKRQQGKNIPYQKTEHNLLWIAKPHLNTLNALQQSRLKKYCTMVEDVETL